MIGSGSFVEPSDSCEESVDVGAFDIQKFGDSDVLRRPFNRGEFVVPPAQPFRYDVDVEIAAFRIRSAEQGGVTVSPDFAEIEGIARAFG